MFRILFASGLILFSTFARAERIPAVQNFVREQLNAIGNVIDEGELGENTFAPTPANASPFDNYYFSGLEIRLQASVGYMLPWAANIQLYPILEFVLERQ